MSDNLDLDAIEALICGSFDLTSEGALALVAEVRRLQGLRQVALDAASLSQDALLTCVRERDDARAELEAMRKAADRGLDIGLHVGDVEASR